MCRDVVCVDSRGHAHLEPEAGRVRGGGQEDVDSADLLAPVLGGGHGHDGPLRGVQPAAGIASARGSALAARGSTASHSGESCYIFSYGVFYTLVLFDYAIVLCYVSQHLLLCLLLNST